AALDMQEERQDQERYGDSPCLLLTTHQATGEHNQKEADDDGELLRPLREVACVRAKQNIPVEFGDDSRKHIGYPYQPGSQSNDKTHRCARFIGRNVIKEFL